jgi:hypothetical protein
MTAMLLRTYLQAAGYTVGLGIDKSEEVFDEALRQAVEVGVCLLGALTVGTYDSRRCPLEWTIAEELHIPVSASSMSIMKPVAHRTFISMRRVTAYWRPF